MKTHIALLRGINVGGNTILPMAELRSLCQDIGLQNVRTYIQSGNVVFESELSEDELVKKLESAIQSKKQKSIPVIIRSVDELESVISRNPFPDAKPSQVGVMFFTDPVPKEIEKDVVAPDGEEVLVSGREIFTHYPIGMGRSKLKFPKMTRSGTVRNINTINKLIQMGRESVK